MTIDRAHDPRFRAPGVLAPMIFIVLFVVAIYGALIVGMLGIADWLIHACQLEFFLKLGNFGIILMMLGLLAAWIATAFICAAVPYYILRARGRYMLASRVASVIIVLVFNIFVFPCILWRIVRANSPHLRRRYRQKLKIMAKSPKMQERRQERRTLATRRHHKPA